MLIYLSKQDKFISLFNTKPYAKNEYKVINNYAERSEGLNNIAKMQQEAEEKVKGTSDLKAGFDYLNKVRSSAEDLRSKLNLTKANSFNQSSLQAQDVANKNKSFAYEISNANRKINASAANNILESEAKYDLQKLKNLNSYITNMTTSYNKKQYDDNVNMFNFKKFDYFKIDEKEKEKPEVKF